MKGIYRAGVVTAAFILMFQQTLVGGQVAAKKVFFLEDVAKKQWCTFGSADAWRRAVQGLGAVQVGALVYSNGHLSGIDVTEEDESGDWIVYDHYFVDDRLQISKLARTINVLPGDRSVVQLFSISNGNADKTRTIETELGTGKPLTSPEPVWLPELSITTSTKAFPFSALLDIQRKNLSGKSCVQDSR